MDFISAIEECTGLKAALDMQPMQSGDVECIFAKVTAPASERIWTIHDIR